MKRKKKHIKAITGWLLFILLYTMAVYSSSCTKSGMPEPEADPVSYFDRAITQNGNTLTVATFSPFDVKFKWWNNDRIRLMTQLYPGITRAEIVPDKITFINSVEWDIDCWVLCGCFTSVEGGDVIYSNVYKFKN